MAIPNTDPSLPSNDAPVFADTNAARGDEMRANNNKIWGNLEYLETEIADKWVRTIYGDNAYGSTIVTDFNAITKSGFYTGYGTATGAPNTGFSWFILHQNSAVGTVSAYQRAVAFSTTLIVYERTKISSAWGSWRESANITPKIEGLIISNNTADVSNDITISAGKCANYERTSWITLSSSLTKRLDATWAAGNNQGLLQTGQTKVGSKSYRIYIISAADGSLNDIIATEYNIPVVLPSGYTRYRYIGSIRTVAAGEIQRFEHLGNEFILQTDLSVFTGTIAAGTTTPAVANIPLGLTRPVLKFYLAQACPNGTCQISSILPDSVVAFSILVFSGADGNNQLSGTIILSATYTFQLSIGTTGARTMYAASYIDRDREAF